MFQQDNSVPDAAASLPSWVTAATPTGRQGPGSAPSAGFAGGPPGGLGPNLDPKALLPAASAPAQPGSTFGLGTAGVSNVFTQDEVAATESALPTGAQSVPGRKDNVPQWRKRPRAPAAIEPESRRLYQMMVEQLHADGLVTAAAAVQEATGCVVPALEMLSTGAPVGPAHAGSANGQRLRALVRLGAAAAQLQQKRVTPCVESCLFGHSLYASRPHPGSVDFRESYVSLPLQRPIRAAGFSPGGEYIAVGTAGGHLRLFSMELVERKVCLVAPTEQQEPTNSAQVRVIAAHDQQSTEWVGFHPTKPFVASASRGGTVTMHDYTDPTPRACWKQDQVIDTYPVRSAAFHPSGEFLAYATDHSTLRLLHLETLKTFTSTEQHQGALADVAFAGLSGQVLATASYDGSWRTLDSRTGAVTTAQSNAHSNVPVTSVAFSRSGNVLLTSGCDAQTKLWDLRKSNTELAAFGEVQKLNHRVRSAFLPGEQTIAIEQPERTAVNIVDVFSGAVVSSMRHSQPIRAFGVACGGLGASPAVATGGDDFRLRVWMPSAAAAATNLALSGWEAPPKFTE